MPHVVLLGDSIFDNGAYVSGGSPILEQLRSRLPRDWRATLLATDGAVVSGVLTQLGRLPPDATHLVVSAGGNNALESSLLLLSPSGDVGAMLGNLAGVQEAFRAEYRRMLRALREARLPTIVCTIYDAIPDLGTIERMGLSLFNDVIMQQAVAARIPVLDLRCVCNEPRDYAEVSPIEPSEIGGCKIAQAIQRVLLGHDFSRTETVVYV